jgi:hypothetical protein
MFHTSGCGMVTLGCLQAGCRMVLISLFDPDIVLDQLEASGADIILGVPTMVVALLDAQEKRPRDLSALKLISCGGSMVAPELVRRVQNLMGAGFSTLYGQTEHCPVITQHHLSDSIDDICNTAGQPVAQTEVSIRSVNDNLAVAIGEVGEICARGPCVMLEYNDNPKATSETVDAMGWLHTGDLGRMDTRGYVTVTGRVKEMIIRGGENLFSRRDRELPVGARGRRRGRRSRPAGPEMGRGHRRVHPWHGTARQGRVARSLPRKHVATENPECLGAGRGLPPDRLGQNPEIRSPRSFRLWGICLTLTDRNRHAGCIQTLYQRPMGRLDRRARNGG